tara:strand:- start:384 stop:1325 length:942 start_codon:yes stop_codon:yes gene_type:complete
MARLVSYPTISTVNLNDLFPVTDTASSGKPLKNVTAVNLLDFIETNAGLWKKITGGIDYSEGNVGIGVTAFTGYLEVQKVNIGDTTTRGLRIQLEKQTTSAGGATANLYGVSTYVKANSTEALSNAQALWGKAEHIGSNTCDFIVGTSARAHHNGSGDSNGVYGVFSESAVIGTGVSTQQNIIGAYNTAKLDNTNATAEKMYGAYVYAQLNAGTVTDRLTVMALDFDYIGTGIVSKHFEYLRIENGIEPPVVGGKARAINSLSTLPSEFAGSVQSAGSINTAIAEYADNATAIAAGLVVGTHYRTGDLLKIVH